MAMLRESSTSTAMMFCCGFNSAMVMAGCHSSTSSTAASRVCKPQIIQTRHPRMTGGACARRERISQARAAAAARINSTSIHLGQAANRENWPRAYTERGYLKRNSNMGPWAACGVEEEARAVHVNPSCLVSHGVGNVVEDDAKSKSGKLFGVLRAVGPLPGVAEMHVGADGHHDASVVTADGAPLGHVAVLFVGSAGVDVDLARDLKFFVDVVQVVVDLVFILKILHGPVGQHLAHAGHEMLPVVSAVEIVHHQETALQQIIVQAFGLLVGEGPGIDVDGVDPGIVEEMVAIEIGDVQGRGRVDAGQTAQCDQAIVVGFGIIAGPTPAKEAKAAAAAGQRELEPAPLELRGYVLAVGVIVGVTAAESGEAVLHGEQTEGEEEQEGAHRVHG